MRKLLALLILAFLPVMAMAGTVQIIGTIHSASGNLFNGSIKFQFPFAGAVDTNCNSVTGSCLVTPSVITVPVVNGALPLSTILTRNGDIQPLNTYYRAFVFSPYGDQLAASNFVIPAGGTTFDIGAALQTTITTSNVSFINPANLSANNTWLGSNNFSTGLTTINFLSLAASVAPDGGGFKHSRNSGGCTTAAVLMATCDSTITWTTPFADAAYTPICVGLGAASGVPLNGGVVAPQLAASIAFRTVAGTAAAAHYGFISCIAVHD